MSNSNPIAELLTTISSALTFYVIQPDSCYQMFYVGSSVSHLLFWGSHLIIYINQG